MAAFIALEVRKALNEMCLDKSPSHDEINPAFYEMFWNIIGAELTEEYFCILSNYQMPSSLNDTEVVLIPKKSKPVVIGHLHPICHSNVLYKIVSKVLANLLKEILPNLI